MDKSALWFIFLAWLLTGLCSCRPAAVVSVRTSPSTDEPLIFVDRSVECGIDFQHQIDLPGSFFMPEIMGSGCAMLDFDRDGDLDVLLVNLGNGYSSGKTLQPPMHRLYEQIEQGRYVDVSERAGFQGRGLGMGVAVGDVNNDGWPDVYFASYGPDQLFLNQGQGRFIDVTEESAIENLHWGSSACFVDYDRDGWLDLFVANYVDYADRPCTRLGGGHRDYCGPQLFPGTQAKLFRNVTGESNAVEVSGIRSARFRDVSLESGIAAQRGPGLGVAAADFNSDGWPDLYVANDQTANFLWINQQNGTFTEEAILRGCAYDGQGNAQASMGVALTDLNRDFDFDLFLTHIDGERSTLYVNQHGQFTDATIAAGLGSVTLPFTGFGTAFVDLDLDGHEDLVIGNGRVKRPESTSADSITADFWYPYRQRGQILMNRGNGHFRERHSERDALIQARELSRGLAAGDLDNDGDLDLIVNRIGTRAAILINHLPRTGNWVRFKLTNPKRGGRDAYGAVIKVAAGNRHWVRCCQPGTSYQSSNDPRIHVGLGTIDQLDQCEVIWPDGTRSEFPVDEVNREYVLEQPAQ